MTEAPLAPPDSLAVWRSGDPGLLVPAAEGAVRSYCRWHIAPERADDEVVVDGSGANVLPLPTLHLTAVTSVTEVDADGVAQPMDLTGVQWSAAGYLRRDTAWTTRLRGVTATITHGYPEVPPEVQAVVLDLAEHLRSTLGGSERRQVGAVSVQVASQAMTELHRMVLDRYRLPSAP